MKKALMIAVALALVAVSTVAMAEPAQQTTQAQPAQQVQAWPSFALNLTGLQTPGAAALAEAALLKVQGVKNIKIDAATNQAWIWYDKTVASPEQIAEWFTKAQTQFQASVAQPQPAKAN